MNVADVLPDEPTLFLVNRQTRIDENQPKMPAEETCTSIGLVKLGFHRCDPTMATSTVEKAIRTDTWHCCQQILRHAPCPSYRVVVVLVHHNEEYHDVPWEYFRDKSGKTADNSLREQRDVSHLVNAMRISNGLTIFILDNHFGVTIGGAKKEASEPSGSVRRRRTKYESRPD